MRIIKAKKEATASPGYVFLFSMAFIICVVFLFLMEEAKLMTHQHEIDDALMDSVLASLVADDVYYFETFEVKPEPVIRFRDRQESFRIYKECMDAALVGTEHFYYHFSYDEFIQYEVEDNTVKVTTFVGGLGIHTQANARLGTVYTPGGELVTKTSAYAKVSFDIKSGLDGSFIRKARDLYCTLKINE